MRIRQYLLSLSLTHTHPIVFTQSTAFIGITEWYSLQIVIRANECFAFPFVWVFFFTWRCCWISRGKRSTTFTAHDRSKFTSTFHRKRRKINKKKTLLIQHEVKFSSFNYVSCTLTTFSNANLHMVSSWCTSLRIDATAYGALIDIMRQQ